MAIVSYDLNMIFTEQDRSDVVTPPRSEGSGSLSTEMLRCAQHDMIDLVR